MNAPKDGNEWQDVSQRIELQPPKSLRDAPALGPTVCHANSVADRDDRCPLVDRLSGSSRGLVFQLRRIDLLDGFAYP